MELRWILGCVVASILACFLSAEIFRLVLKGTTKWKLKKLRKLDTEVDRLAQDDDHWSTLLSELSVLDNEGLRDWLNKMRSAGSPE